MDDQPQPDEDRGIADSPEAHGYIKSRTPAERKAERDSRELQRQHDSQKGADGIQRTHGGVTRPSSGGAGEPGPFIPILASFNTNGAFTTAFIWGQSPPG